MVRLVSEYLDGKYTIQDAIKALRIGRRYTGFLKKVSQEFGDLCDFNRLSAYKGTTDNDSDMIEAPLKSGVDFDDILNKFQEILNSRGEYTTTSMKKVSSDYCAISYLPRYPDIQVYLDRHGKFVLGIAIDYN